MSSNLWFTFGSGDPRLFTGITPTFLIFMDQSANAVTPPPIVEKGISTGIFYASYMPSPTLSIAFLVDGGASVSSGRYITGSIDPIINIDQQLGFSQDSYGTTARPSTVFGYVKRSVEEFESDASFNKTTGKWDSYAKGTSTLLIEKTLSNSTTAVTKV